MGSVDGVSTAPIITEIKITYFHNFNIVWPDIIPSIPKIIWKIGIWNAIPVVENRINIKSQYWLNDHNGSITSEL